MVALLHAGHALTHALHNACCFMTQNGWEEALRICTRTAEMMLQPGHYSPSEQRCLTMPVEGVGVGVTQGCVCDLRTAAA